MIQYANTSIGYSHIENKTICQDFSCNYYDKERIIIAVCDGHGGKVYFRSDRGSKFAGQALLQVLQSVDIKNIDKLNDQEYLNKIKLKILCEWNALVERDISRNPFTKEELEKFDEDELLTIENTPEVAYGTTLNGAMLLDKFFICVQLGDGGLFSLNKYEFNNVFEDDEENVANLTYSMCQQDAFDHIKIKVLNKKEASAILMCTDGLLAPYQTYSNFEASFIKPFIKNISKGKELKVFDSFINSLGKKKGVGDDVSFGFIVDDKLYKKLYKAKKHR